MTDPEQLLPQINYTANQDLGQTGDFHSIIQSTAADNKVN